MLTTLQTYELARRLLKRATRLPRSRGRWGWFREEAMLPGPDDTGSPKNACDIENGTAQDRRFLGSSRGKEGALAVTQTRWKNRRSPNPLPVWSPLQFDGLKLTLPFKIRRVMVSQPERNMTRLLYFATAKLNTHCRIEHTNEVFHDSVLASSIGNTCSAWRYDRCRR
jgi:hypothetical protein